MAARGGRMSSNFLCNGLRPVGRGKAKEFTTHGIFSLISPKKFIVTEAQNPPMVIGGFCSIKLF